MILSAHRSTMLKFLLKDVLSQLEHGCPGLPHHFAVIFLFLKITELPSKYMRLQDKIMKKVKEPVHASLHELIRIVSKFT